MNAEQELHVIDILRKFYEGTWWDFEYGPERYVCRYCYAETRTKQEEPAAITHDEGCPVLDAQRFFEALA